MERRYLLYCEETDMRRLNRGLTRILLSVAVGLVLAATGSRAMADSPAMSFTAAPVGFSPYQTLGWSFTTNANVTVDALGYYDLGADGLSVSHAIGLFNSTGTLLTSTTVAPGIVDPLIGSFRYALITPITLAAGQTFTIGGTTDTIGNPAGFDFWGFNVIGLTTDPSITIPAGAGRFKPTVGNSLVFPDLIGDSQVFAGPNFLIAPASAVPEPGSLALLATGALPLLGIAQRKRLHASAI
jgi:hypothetical protein